MTNVGVTMLSLFGQRRDCSSGGPWLHDYNDANGLGYVNSVVSHRHDDPNQMDGPYFDNDIKSLYDFAESLSP